MSQEGEIGSLRLSLPGKIEMCRIIIIIIIIFAYLGNLC